MCSDDDLPRPAPPLHPVNGQLPVPGSTNKKIVCDKCLADKIAGADEVKALRERVQQLEADSSAAVTASSPKQPQSNEANVPRDRVQQLEAKLAAAVTASPPKQSQSEPQSDEAKVLRDRVQQLEAELTAAATQQSEQLRQQQQQAPAAPDVTTALGKALPPPSTGESKDKGSDEDSSKSADDLSLLKKIRGVVADAAGDTTETLDAAAVLDTLMRMLKLGDYAHSMSSLRESLERLPRRSENNDNSVKIPQTLANSAIRAGLLIQITSREELLSEKEQDVVWQRGTKSSGDAGVFLATKSCGKFGDDSDGRGMGFPEDGNSWAAMFAETEKGAGKDYSFKSRGAYQRTSVVVVVVVDVVCCPYFVVVVVFCILSCISWWWSLCVLPHLTNYHIVADRSYFPRSSFPIRHNTPPPTHTHHIHTPTHIMYHLHDHSFTNAIANTTSVNTCMWTKPANTISNTH
jgi:hypothetical protein